VAFAKKEGLEATGVNVSVMKTTEAEDIEYFDYNLVCVSVPNIQWHLPKQVTEFLLKKIDEHRTQKKSIYVLQKFPERTR